MKESLVWFFILLWLFNFGDTKKTELVVDQIEHGITSPRYIDNPLYKVTNAKYDEFPGELTRPGIYQMEAIGKELRKEYIDQNKFLPNDFKPENFYLKTYRDQPSSLSSYATMLGAYPNSVAWIQYQSMGRGSAEAPFTKEEEADVRKALSLSDNPSRLSTRDVTIWAETDGRTFFNDPLNNCPQMHKEMNHNLDIANSKYTDNKRFEGMFEAMEKTLGIADETLTFKNAHLYLDDYATAEANNKPHPEFKEQIVADSYISNYYRRFYYEGKFGNDLNLARVSSNHFFSYLLTSMYGKYKVAKGEISNQHYEHLKYAQFVGNENSLIGLDKLLNDNPVDPILPPRFGSKYRFELFEDAGKYFVKTTMDGEPAKIKGATDGVMPYENFMKYIYSLLYFGNVDKYCSGQESLTGKDKPQEANYEKYIWEQHSELRGEQKTASTQTKNTGFTEQKFVEIEQRSEPKVVEVVEPIVVSRPPPRPQGQIIYNYQGEASANRREYISPPPPRQQYISAPPPPRQQYTPAPPPPIYQNSYHTTQSTQRSEYTQEPSFIDIVEKCKALEVQAKPAPAKAAQYNMYETLEHKVDIPYLHPVDIPQVIHDTKYVVVPKAVPKAVIHEKLITEKPTEIHHIKIDMEEAAPIAAPVQFAEVVPEKAGWPWWWWIPLLLLWCCLPLLCCCLYLLCCRKKPEKKVAKATPPARAPAKVKTVIEKPKPAPKDDTAVAQRKKFAYTKNEYDQEKEIEADIQRELEMSRVRKTEALRNKPPVIYHHTRYIEKPRYVEEANLTPYERTATYDAVNRSTHNYQHIDDSYYLQQRPERVERVVERDYNPGVTQIDSRRSPRSRSGTYVNPQYQADAAVSPNAASRRSGEGYVSREQVVSSSRHMSTAGGAQGHQTSPFAAKREGLGSGRPSGKALGSGRPSGRELGSGTRSGRELGSGRASGREVEEQFFREGPTYKEDSVIVEERKYTGGRAISQERAGSPVSYSSNQRLKADNATSKFAEQRTELKRASAAKKKYVEDSEDDDEDSY